MTTDRGRPGPLPIQASSNTDDRGELRYRVLSLRAIWSAAGVILLVGVGVAVWLLLAYGQGGDQARNQLEAIKTAGTIVVGAGGAAALLLAARRQRTIEIALRQKDRDQALQERIAEDARTDAAARRITELYTKAADQLGSDKAPVRLTGFYALERLAQDNPDQRQTIVNVLCAYLRMPYQPPGTPPAEDADASVVAEHRERIQEREVRLAAQRLLTTHLRPGKDPAHPLDTFWPDLDLDLTAAVLLDLDLAHCHLRTATFANTQFTGKTEFNNTQFTGDAEFNNTQFNAYATFANTQFTGDAEFNDAKFTGDAKFNDAKFNGDAGFSGAQFNGNAWFDKPQFAGDADFTEAQFSQSALFHWAQFTGDAGFRGAQFNGGGYFANTQFNGDASFFRAQFTGGGFREAQFTGNAEFNEAQFTGNVEFGGAQFAWGVPVQLASVAQSLPAIDEDGTTNPAETG